MMLDSAYKGVNTLPCQFAIMKGELARYIVVTLP